MMIADFSRSQSRLPIFSSFPRLLCVSSAAQTHTYRHGCTQTCAETGTLKRSRGKWRCADCPLRLLHYLFFLCLLSILCSHFLPFFCSLCGPLLAQPLSGVCASISYPHCPVSCHPFTRPSSLCHHQGPGGLLRSASGEKGLYLGNAPSNRSS